MKRLLLMVFCSLLACNVFAATNLKIGIINVNQVILKSAMGMSFNAKLASDFQPRQDALTSAQKKLQDDVDQLTFNGYKLSDTDRNALQTTINNEKVQVNSMGTSLQKDFAAAQNQYSQTMMTKLGDVINQIAKDEHYDLIQTNANTLFLSTAVDITAQVTAQMK